MEVLQENVLEIVCNNFSPRDLAALCAVSRDFRDLFNKDVFWRPHCDQELCGYLRVRPCHVEPKFTSPAVEGSGLSELCQWRLHYMRQVHFYNNWRHERYKQKLLLDPWGRMKYGSTIFYNDDTLIVWNDRGVLLFDVTQSPPKPLHSLFDHENSATNNVQVCGENIVIVTGGYETLVVFAPSGDRTWTRTCKFKFQCNSGSFFLAGKWFFSTFEGNLKIWSIETGVLVKQEVVGEEFCNYAAFESMKSILAFTEGIEKLCLYDLANLKFLPLITKCDKYSFVADCKFHENLLICSTATGPGEKLQYWIEVYDYLKNTLVTFVSCTEFSPTWAFKIELFQNEVILYDDICIWKFDAAKGQILTKLYEGEGEERKGAYRYRFFGNKYILFSPYEVCKKNYGIIKLCFKGKKYLNWSQARNHAVYDHILRDSNKHCVKMVTELEEGSLYLLHMW